MAKPPTAVVQNIPAEINNEKKSETHINEAFDQNTEAIAYAIIRTSSQKQKQKQPPFRKISETSTLWERLRKTYYQLSLRLK